MTEHQNSRFTVCLSHDVDRIRKTLQFGTHLAKALKELDPGAAAYQIRTLFQRRHYWNFEKIMDLENGLGLRSTFFFLNETYPFRLLDVSSWRLSLGYYDIFDPLLQRAITELDSRGWEVGLHGSYLSYRSIELLRKEKADLENIVGHPIMGIRQHYLNLDESTWALQSDAGFRYDASFGFTDAIGFKDRCFHSFEPLPGRDFKVVPLALMDSCIMRSKDPLNDALKVVAHAEENRACLVLNWHQRMFNEREFPGYTEMYVRLINECKDRDARFTTIGQYVRGSSGGLKPRGRGTLCPARPEQRAHRNTKDD